MGSSGATVDVWFMKVTCLKSVVTGTTISGIWFVPAHDSGMRLVKVPRNNSSSDDVFYCIDNIGGEVEIWRDGIIADVTEWISCPANDSKGFFVSKKLVSFLKSRCDELDRDEIKESVVDLTQRHLQSSASVKLLNCGWDIDLRRKEGFIKFIFDEAETWRMNVSLVNLSL